MTPWSTEEVTQNPVFKELRVRYPMRMLMGTGQFAGVSAKQRTG